MVMGVGGSGCSMARSRGRASTESPRSKDLVCPSSLANTWLCRLQVFGSVSVALDTNWPSCLDVIIEVVEVETFNGVNLGYSKPDEKGMYHQYEVEELPEVIGREALHEIAQPSSVMQVSLCSRGPQERRPLSWSSGKNSNSFAFPSDSDFSGHQFGYNLVMLAALQAWAGVAQAGGHLNQRRGAARQPRRDAGACAAGLGNWINASLAGQHASRHRRAPDINAARSAFKNGQCQHSYYKVIIV